MVTRESVEQQLKRIGFKTQAWGRTEVNELPNIMLPEEEIKDCVNGFYEGGFALLVATNIRVLLVDKKPLRFLTVEDLRFDMINEIDYSHRLMGARISISTGSKNLKFTSLNQPRLRSLITHVQNCMAESKAKQSEHQEDQKLHLEQINQQLQTYLLAQHQQQQKLQEQLGKVKSDQQLAGVTAQVKPGNELSDYLYAQSLLAQYNADHGASAQQAPAGAAPIEQGRVSVRPPAADLYEEGMKEVFGHSQQAKPATVQPAQRPPAYGTSSLQQMAASAMHHAQDVNPLRIAYSKLPMAMRNRRFGRPSFHAHSQAEEPELEPDSMVPDAHTDIVPAQYS